MAVQPEKVVILGQGYVGLPVAMRAVDAGFDVVGFDIDSRRVAALRAGTSFVEDVPDRVLAAALATGRYRPTDDPASCAGFDIGVISVPTPLHDGIPDLRHIEEASRTLGTHLARGATVVLESTTYPGTTDELVGPILRAESGLVPGVDFHLGFSPERIDPGNQMHTFVNTPKIVSGVNDESLQHVDRFYSRLVDKTIPVSGTREAELAKLLENTFRHVNIALVNELAVFANELGINIWEAIDAASTKPFGYLRFVPGPGVGGHCLPIDPSYLSWRVRRALGQSFRFVELANDVNDHMPDYVVRRLVLGLNTRGVAVKGRRILLLGLSYKKNTGDARESPSQRVAEELLSLGAEVHAADPLVDPNAVVAGVRHVELTAAEVEAADAVVVLVDHDAFDLAVLTGHARYVLDCRNCVTGPNVELL